MQLTLWMLAGVALALIEAHAPGYFLIFLGLGCFAAAFATFATAVGPSASVAVFVAATLLLLLVAAGPYRRLLRGRAATKVNTPDRLVGTTGRVEEPIAYGSGKIRLGDTLWLASGPDLAKGTAVRVVSVDGTRLKVEAMDAPSSTP